MDESKLTGEHLVELRLVERLGPLVAVAVPEDDSGDLRSRFPSRQRASSAALIQARNSSSGIGSSRTGGRPTPGERSASSPVPGASSSSSMAGDVRAAPPASRPLAPFAAFPLPLPPFPPEQATAAGRTRRQALAAISRERRVWNRRRICASRCNQSAAVRTWAERSVWIGIRLRSRKTRTPATIVRTTRSTMERECRRSRQVHHFDIIGLEAASMRSISSETRRLRP